MALVDRIRDVALLDFSRVRPWRVADAVVGWIPHDIARALALMEGPFQVTTEGVALDPALSDFDARSAAVDVVVQTLCATGRIRHLRGERYAVAVDFDDEPLLSIDRGAAGAFGVRTCGVHLVGYVGDGAAMRVWVARRAIHKPTWPGKLDLLAAGGQPMGISLYDNLVKEAQEEAGVPDELARRARPAGMVSFLTENLYGVDNGIGVVYDLALPANFVPRSVDGEVAAFELWPVDRLVERLASADEFVFDSALVAIDFLIRRGFLEPDDPDYLEIGLGLRR